MSLAGGRSLASKRVMEPKAELTHVPSLFTRGDYRLPKNLAIFADTSRWLAD